MQNVSKVRHHPQLLVSRVFSAFKTRGQRFASQRSSPCGMCGLVQAEINILQHFVRKVGNGQLIKAGLDKWVNGRRPKIKDSVSLLELKISFILAPPLGIIEN